MIHWRASAYAALLVTAVHGGIFYAVRSRQRRVRAATLAEARSALRLLIDTQRSALLSLHASAADVEEQARMEGIGDALDLLDYLVDSLSEESLRLAPELPRVSWSVPEEGGAAPRLDFRMN